MHTPSSHATSRSISTSAKHFDSRGKAINSNQSSSSITAAQWKTSKIECFKCGGHGHKQAKCPNRRTIIALADGSYDSQSEEEDEPITQALADLSPDTCEYSVEDGTFELGLNCLAIQSLLDFAQDDLSQDDVLQHPAEITCADFDKLLADFPDLAPSTLNTPAPSLVVQRVLSTQFVAAEQGQRHNLFQSRCKVKGQVAASSLMLGAATILLVLCLLRNLVCRHVAIHIRITCNG